MNRLIAIITICFFSNVLSAQSLTLQDNWWEPNGEVKSIVKDSANNLLYLGGSFTYIGPNEKNGSQVNAETGEVSFEFVNPNGIVYASISDGNGGWYIGGTFTIVGDSLRDNLAHINQFGLVTSWKPEVNGTVFALTESDSILYIGGDFTTVNNQGRNYLAAFNKISGMLINWNPSTNGPVYTIEFGDANIYAGGSFSLVNGQSHSNFVQLNLLGAPTSLNTTVNSQVNDIVYANSVIYLGGYFTEINGELRSRIAAVNSSTGLNESLNLGIIDGNVNTVSISNNTLFIGGDFDFIGGQYRNNVASVDLLSETLNQWAPLVQTPVYAFSNYGSEIFIGCTNGAFNESVDVLSKFDVITAEKIASWKTDADGHIATISLGNNSMYIGGAFYSIGGMIRNRLTAIDMLTGEATDWNPDANHRVFEMSLLDTTLYVAGYFSQIGQSSRVSIAAINTNTGLATSWNPNPQTPIEVTTIVPTDSAIYVGGYFSTTIGGQTRQNFVVLDSDLGLATPLNVYQLCCSAVTNMIVVDTSIYISGNYSSSGQPFLMAINKNTGITTNWNPMLNGGIVQHMKYEDSLIYLSGNFTGIGGQTRTGIAALSPVTGLATSWNPNIWPSNPLGTQLGVFTINSSTIYVNTSIGITAIDRINSNFSNFALPGSAFECTNEQLFIGGYYYFTFNEPVRNFSVLGICFTQQSYISELSCNDYLWPVNGQTYTTSGTYVDTILTANGCDSIITLNLTIVSTTFNNETITSCNDYIWLINGQTYTTSGTYTDTIPNANGCDSIITLNLTIIPSLPLTVNLFSQPSDANLCVGNLSISANGALDFTETIDGGSPFTHSGYILVNDLCPGVHSLFTTNGCGDTLTQPFVIPVDSNYIFNNPFIDSIAVDSLGATIEDCEIYYNGIDTAYIDSIFATGNTVTVIWNIVDSNGSNVDTSTYELNNGNGVYYLQLSIFCPTKALGDYFTVTEAIYFEDGNISTASLAVLDDDLFQLFPNPTSDLITIRFEAPKAELVIYDAQGKHIQSQNIQSGEVVSLGKLETGIYFFELTTGTGRTVKRVVKQ